MMNNYTIKIKGNGNHSLLSIIENPATLRWDILYYFPSIQLVGNWDKPTFSNPFDGYFFLMENFKMKLID